jgi:YVTN family beta-propeller protein
MLEFRLLGPIEAIADSASLDLGGPKQRAVLALLLLRANEVLPRERLIDDLWGDDPPATARQTLKAYVGRLRKVISVDDASGRLRSSGGGYVFELDPERLDLHRFQQLADRGTEALAHGDATTAAALLRDALSLWRGRPLEDLGGAAFVGSERARLEELRLVALENRIDADLTLDRERAVVPELQQLTREHPYRERLHRQLMLALYRSGRQAAYGDLRRRLASELGLEPSRESQDMQRAILAADPALTPARNRHTPTWPAAEEEAAPAPRSRRVGVRVIALGVLVACVAVGVAAVRALSGGGHAAARAQPTAAGRVVATIPVPLPGGPWVGSLAFGAGSLWVRKSGDDHVLRVDPRTNTITARIRVGFAYDNGIAIRGDDVWVTNGEDGTVSRIDALTNQVAATIHVGAYPLGIVVTKGAVWVANHHSGTVSRIDPRVNRVVATVPISTQTEIAGPKAIAADRDSVWVADAYNGAVVRVDAQRDRRVESIGESGPACGGMALFRGSVWVASACDRGTVTRIDARTAIPTARIHVPGVALDVAAGSGSIWVTAIPNTLLRIDPKTNHVVGRVHLRDAAWMTSGGGNVWVLDRVSRSVDRVKPAHAQRANDPSR